MTSIGERRKPGLIYEVRRGPVVWVYSGGADLSRIVLSHTLGWPHVFNRYSWYITDVYSDTFGWKRLNAYEMLIWFAWDDLFLDKMAIWCLDHTLYWHVNFCLLGQLIANFLSDLCRQNPSFWPMSAFISHVIWCQSARQCHIYLIRFTFDL